MNRLARPFRCLLLALAWVLAKGEDLVPIPGTARVDHLEENAAAGDIELTDDQVAELEALVTPQTVHGSRYSAASQAEVDTEI
jgi:aryl-alcohol dehydrogenase-like predicted oxidoreductase